MNKQRSLVHIVFTYLQTRYMFALIKRHNIYDYLIADQCEEHNNTNPKEYTKQLFRVGL